MPPRLLAADFIDPQIGYHFAYFGAFHQVKTQLHQHDFFELLLIIEGRIRHQVNGQGSVLQAGDMLLIRPDDVHRFRRYSDEHCVAINLAFTTQTLDALLAYLDFPLAAISTPSYPPLQRCSPALTARLAERMQALALLPATPDVSRSALRAFLAEILIEHFGHLQTIHPNGVPQWLQALCLEMTKPDNFAAGRSALSELAGRSDEHLARSFRKYLGVTPTEYINQLRLAYTARMLAHTDLPVNEIAQSAGFDNLSYFYRLFRDGYGMPPAQYRRQSHVTAIQGQAVE